MGKVFIQSYDRVVRSILKSKKKYLKYKKNSTRAQKRYLKYIRVQRNHKPIEWPTYTEYSRPQGNVRSRQY